MHSELYIGAVAALVPIALLFAEKPGVEAVRSLRLGEMVVILVALAGVGLSVYALCVNTDPGWVRASVSVSMCGALLGAVVLRRLRDRASSRISQTRFSKLMRAVLISLALVGAAAVGWWFRAMPSSSSGFLSEYARQVFTVEGTCVNHKCGLKQHVHPYEHSPTQGVFLKDGERIELLCQRFGGVALSAMTGRSSRLWDLEPDKLWVTDLYVTTSKKGDWSAELPECPAKVAS